MNILGSASVNTHTRFCYCAENGHRQIDGYGCVPIQFCLWILKYKFHVIFTFMIFLNHVKP